VRERVVALTARVRISLGGVKIAMLRIMSCILVACVSVAFQYLFFYRFFNVVFFNMATVVRSDTVNSLHPISGHVEPIITVNSAVPEVELALRVSSDLVLLVAKLIGHPHR